MGKPARCEFCGELIPCPVPRLIDGHWRIVCIECSDDERDHPPIQGRRDPVTRHEVEYHGGRFHSAEW